MNSLKLHRPQNTRALGVIVVFIAILSLCLSLWSIGSNNIVRADQYTYETLEYIQFDGSRYISDTQPDAGSYIDTGIDQLGDIKVSIEFANIDTQGWLFGAGSNLMSLAESDMYGVRIRTDNAGQTDFHYGDVGAISASDILGTVTGGRQTIIAENNVAQLDSEPIVTAPYPAPTNPHNILLGAAYNGDTGSASVGKFNGLIYSFKIYKNNVLVRDLVPSVRYLSCGQSSVEYGFVDIANNNQWYGNAGVGTLSGSKSISLTACPITDVNNNPSNSLNAPNTGIGRK